MAFFKNSFRKPLLQKLLPYFLIVTAILIMVLNDAFGDQDGFVVFSLLFFTLMTVWTIRWIFIQIRFILKLKKEKKQAELMHLKSQVNPHFFFNSLNNLYGLVEEDAAKAQQLILKLSDMMRYSIYEGQNDWVALGDEIKYIEGYMDLHRMRYHKRIDIRFDIQAEDMGIKMMPLLFIILVENAFKHGVERLRNDAFVHVRLSATRQIIDFEIENNFDPGEVAGKEGIGLKNLKQRLELVYLNRYELEFSSVQPDRYRARLRLVI